jgi:nucleotide-binding universal stress UspA family protein
MATLVHRNLKNAIALKNILLATDFAVSANRAVPFALSLADHYGAKLYAAHVIPEEAYVLARPESIERILKETRDYAEYKLNQLVAPSRSVAALAKYWWATETLPRYSQSLCRNARLTW